MYRSAMEDLKKWKNSKRRKPLILDGARQVGKTWLLQKFGLEEYENMAYVNLEKDERASEIFDGSFEPQRIVARLALHLGMEIKSDKTLIVIDEAQQNARALTALKYFQEEAPEYHIVVAGSLLGIAIHQGVSFPVGKVNHLYIHPLTFWEFLVAIGRRQLADAIMARDFELIQPFHAELLEFWKIYTIVGGMPEVVQTYLNDRSMLGVRAVQIDILHDYERDFSKYADKFTAPKIVEIFNIIPAVLAKENKKFMFGMIRASARAREYDNALLWLNRAGVAIKVNRVSKVAQPLSAYLDQGAFKLFCVDVGLLSCKAGLHPEVIYNGDRFEEFKGALAEQFVFQELYANGVEPYYYSADDSQAEVDFVINDGARIVPIEVKSGENLSAPSLKKLLQKDASLRAVKFSMLPYAGSGEVVKGKSGDGGGGEVVGVGSGESGRVANMPIYAAFACMKEM